MALHLEYDPSFDITTTPKPFGCDPSDYDAPLPPEAPHRARILLAAQHQKRCAESMNASFSHFGQSSFLHKECKYPRLVLGVQHRRYSTGSAFTDAAVTEFQTAFEKMKEKGHGKKTQPSKKKNNKKLGVMRLESTKEEVEEEEQATNAKIHSKSTAAALEKLNAMFPASSPTRSLKSDARRLNARFSPQGKTFEGVRKVSSSGKLGLLSVSGFPRVPSGGRIDSMRRVRSSDRILF